MYNETIRLGWDAPAAAVAADDTLVTAAVDTMLPANVPDDAYQPDGAHNAIEAAFLMNADAAACVAYVFAARDNGDIVLVWTGTLTAGKQEHVVDGDVWVDTFASTTDNWITTIKEIDGGGADRMARIAFDSCGYKYFFTQFTGLSSETARAYYSGF